MMGKVDIPLFDQEPEKKKELPRCAWCGSFSRTICGRCKVRAYCSAECQRNDWKAGHQTACSAATRQESPPAEHFTFYDIPYIAHWAINLRRWTVQRESREFEFLLSRLPESAREFIKGRRHWRSMKVALARELVVRRMAEILTQGQWEKTSWKHDRRTGRDYLVDRSSYVWTGQKYINANVRFPNFNFSLCESGEYLFATSHPSALTGVYAAPPLTLQPLPDPIEAFASQLDDVMRVSTEGSDGIEAPALASPSTAVLSATAATSVQGSLIAIEPTSRSLEGCTTDLATRECFGTKIAAADTARKPEEAEPTVEHIVAAESATVETGSNNSGATEFAAGRLAAEATDVKEGESETVDEEPMFGEDELLAICAPEENLERQRRFRQAMVGKMAYCRTIGEKSLCRWSEVVLECSPVDPCYGGELQPQDPDALPEAAGNGHRRHHLIVKGTRQKKWRCEVHNLNGYCIVVARAPAEEAQDYEGQFTSTQAARFADIDQYDKVLEHEEPRFIEVPIMQLLPDKYHSDYIRACGRGEKGEQVRMNH